MTNQTTVEQYLELQPEPAHTMLVTLRALIRGLVPEAVETISYGIPTFKWKGKNLIHIAGYKNHIGLYPGSGAISHFENELKGYNTSKGAVQFPLSAPMPNDLIIRIVKFCIEQSEKKAQKKTTKTKDL